MIWLLLYVLLGLGAVMLGAWLYPQTYGDKDPYGCRGIPLVLTFLGWPIALPVMAAFRLVDVTIRAKEKKVAVREELERELADARREVEALLRRK